MYPESQATIVVGTETSNIVQQTDGNIALVVYQGGRNQALCCQESVLRCRSQGYAYMVEDAVCEMRHGNHNNHHPRDPWPLSRTDTGIMFVIHLLPPIQSEDICLTHRAWTPGLTVRRLDTCPILLGHHGTVASLQGFFRCIALSLG